MKWNGFGYIRVDERTCGNCECECRGLLCRDCWRMAWLTFIVSQLGTAVFVELWARWIQ